MVALPLPWAVTLPLSSTVATASLSLSQITAPTEIALPVTASVSPSGT